MGKGKNRNFTLGSKIHGKLVLLWYLGRLWGFQSRIVYHKSVSLQPLLHFYHDNLASFRISASIFQPFQNKNKKTERQQPTHQATSAVNLTATGKLRATVSHRQTTDDPTWQHVSCLGYRPPPNLVVASRPTPRGRPHPGHRRITSHVCYFAVTQASPMGTLSKPNLSSPILLFRGEMVLGFRNLSLLLISVSDMVLNTLFISYSKEKTNRKINIFWTKRNSFLEWLITHQWS